MVCEQAVIYLHSTLTASIAELETLTAGHLYNRVQVISIGCCLWGICTAGFSMCQSLKQGYIFWAVNGIGLSLVIPTGQSLIADYYQVKWSCSCVCTCYVCRIVD